MSNTNGFEEQPMRFAEVARRRRRLLVVDDDPLITRFWVRVLPEIEVVGALSLAEGYELLAPERWVRRPFQYIILDLELRDGYGADLLTDIARFRPRPQVAVISGALTSERVAGVHGQCSIALPKPISFATAKSLIDVLDTHASPAGRALAFAARYALDKPETELVTLTLAGISAFELPRRLNCTENTLARCWARVFFKSGCQSQVEVAVRALSERVPWSVPGSVFETQSAPEDSPANDTGISHRR